MKKFCDFFNSVKFNRFLERADDFIACICIMMLAFVCRYVHDPSAFVDAGYNGDTFLLFSFVWSLLITFFVNVSFYFVDWIRGKYAR